MKYKQIKIEESPDQQNFIHKISIPKELLDKSCELDPYRLMTIKIGFSEYQVLPTLNNYTECIELPHTLMKKMGLYSGFRCNAYIEKGVLNLGPVVAIFVSKVMIRKARKQIFSTNVNEYLNANKIAKCILYFFCIDDVDFIKRRVNGTTYNQKESHFETRSYPLPDVLYDRGGSRYDLINVSNYIRSQFEKVYEMKKVNAQSFFDKLHIYEVISKNQDLKLHQPFTEAYSKRNLRELFTENKTIYVKARIGSNGRSVMKVVKESNQSYKYSTARGNIICNTVNSFEKLTEEINSFFHNRKLLIQTKIELLKIDGCIVDMRATVQRDSNGVLGITVYVVRVAQKNSPVTSTASGSSVYEFEEFFKSVMNYTEDQIVCLKSKIEEFLINIYECLEESYGAFGEMGIDFGIDNKEKIWFIESNSKPAKSTIHLLGDHQVLQKSYLYPLEYAKYLASLNE